MFFLLFSSAAVSLLFLLLVVSGLLSTQKSVSEALSDEGSQDLRGPQNLDLEVNQRLSAGPRFTFLAAEDARSGFTDSAFSLLEDFDLLLFSFSTESGESQDGLELLLFLKESGETGGAA